MDTIAVNCNRCGAPLRIHLTAKYVTCRFCQCALKIQRDETTFFTTEVQDLRAAANTLSLNVDEISLKLELERLDREWAEEKRNLCPPNGEPPVPQFYFGFGVAVSFFLAFLPGLNGMARPTWPLALLTLGFFGFMSMTESSRRDAWNAAQRKYEVARAELTQRSGADSTS